MVQLAVLGLGILVVALVHRNVVGIQNFNLHVRRIFGVLHNHIINSPC